MVSAVIPARNAASLVGEAIAGVLGQSHPRLECIVVNDGSTDDTAAVAAGCGDRVRVASVVGAGVAAARNHGASLARGEFLAFCDADDLWRPQRVQRQLQAMRSSGSLAAVCATAWTIKGVAGERLIRLTPAEPTLESLLLWRGSVVSPSSSLLIEREYFLKCGGFDERLSTATDWELLLRLVADGRLVYVDEPLVEWRWHDDNMSHDLALTERDMRRAYGIALERHAAALSISNRRAMGGMHRAMATSFWRRRQLRPALRHAWKAVARDPLAVPFVVRSHVEQATRAVVRGAASEMAARRHAPSGKPD